MKPYEIMRHFYGINYEDYQRQDFDLSVMGSTIIGFDISIFSIRFNFVDPFTIRMEEVIKGEDDDENEYHYQPLAILTKNQDDSGSQLFFFNRSTKLWESANTRDHNISKEEMDQKFIKTVYYINTGEEETE